MGAGQLIWLGCILGLAMGRPGKWILPEVPAGRRAEYYVQHNTGDYRFGYDTGEGQYHRVDGTAAGDVTGEFGFVDPEGADVKVEYTANGDGFLVHGADALVQATGFGQKVTSGSSSSESEHSVSGSSAADSDASYAFAFDAGDHSRSESSDAQGNVEGQFAFVADDGVNRAVTYEAGSNTGFLAVGDHLPKPVEVALEFGQRISTSSQVAGSNNIEHSVSNVVGSAESDTDPAILVKPSNFYQVPAVPVAPSIQLAPAVPAVPVSPIQVVPVITVSKQSSLSHDTEEEHDANADASYNFSFESDEYARSETADASGRVTGQYSFVTGEGKLRTITYIAGEGIGFTIQGDTLSDLDEATLTRIRTAAAERLAQQQTHAQDPIATSSLLVHHDSAADTAINADNAIHSVATISGDAAVATAALSAESAGEYDAAREDPLFDPNIDPSYSFEFTSDEHSRTESADASGTIRGRYSFVTADGQRRTITYEAGSETGFIIHSDSLSDIDSATLARIQEAAATRAQLQDYTQNHAAPEITHNDDGSYSFSYDAETHSRSEAGDSNNQVDGTFSFVADDGIDRSVSYTAGAEAGFTASGAHLPVPVPVLSETITVFGHTGASNTDTNRVYSSVSVTSDADSQHEVSSTNEEYRPEEDDPNFDSEADRSYAFNFASDEHSRSETSDADGTVTGFYSLITADGKKRTITYRSGAGIGFEIVSDVVSDADKATLDRIRAAAAERAQASHQSLTDVQTGSFGYTYNALALPVLPAVPSSLVTSQQTSADAASSANCSPDSDSKVDLSHSISYDAADHSRQEQSDASGTVDRNQGFISSSDVISQSSAVAHTATGALSTSSVTLSSSGGERVNNNMPMPLLIQLPETLVQRGFQHELPDKFGYSFDTE